MTVILDPAALEVRSIVDFTHGYVVYVGEQFLAREVGFLVVVGLLDRQIDVLVVETLDDTLLV